MTLEEIYKKNKTVEGRIIKFHADRRPVTFILGLFLLQLAAWHYLPLWAAVIAGLLFLPLLGSVATYNHHHQHHNTFNAAVLNRSFEIILGTQTMITAYAWVLHHNFGHHPNYLNQPPCPGRNEDESRWARRDGSPMGPIEYSLNLLVRAPYDSLRVGWKRPRLLVCFFLMMIPYLALQALLAWQNPANYLAVFLGPAACVLLYVYYLTHEHHSGLYTDNHYAASRNRTGKFYNLRTSNLGYHTAHHIKPYLHWSLLPHYHALIAHEIPPECYVKCR
ncbi:MAG: fatty acid desaturase [bacterium]|nr:fatty acid desaturase [bacterium]